MMRRAAMESFRWMAADLSLSQKSIFLELNCSVTRGQRMLDKATSKVVEN